MFRNFSGGAEIDTGKIEIPQEEVLQAEETMELIEEKYEGRVDLVIDGGYGGLEPSTVVDCTTDEFTLLRQGKGEISI